MSTRTALHRRPFLGALEQLFGHPGTLYDRLDAAHAELRVMSSGMPEGTVRTEARELKETLERSLRSRGAVPIGEAIELARRVVDLHDRIFGEEGEGRTNIFIRSWQQLHAAVLILCSEPGSIQQRLADACALGLRWIDARELPRIVRPPLLAMQTELAAIARSESGLLGLSEEQAKEIATQLILLYVHVLGVKLDARYGEGRGAVACAI
jgi:hypothetical protein